MLYKRIIMLGIIAVSAGLFKPAYAQKDSYLLPGGLPRVTYGNIPDSLLQMKTYSAAPDADYIYAYKGLDIRFLVENNSIEAILKYLVRIKVLDSEGGKASVVDIPYYFQNNIESIMALKGETIHPDGTRIPLDTTGIRTISVNSRVKLKEFTLPNPTPGSVLEYAYTVKRRYIEELPDFYFMNTAPTAYSLVRLINSKYIRYDATPVNMKKPPHHIRQSIDTSSVHLIFTQPHPPPVIIDNWYEFNVPALHKEPYITSLDDYRWKMKFIWKEFGNPRQELEKSWDIVAAEIRKRHGLEDNMEKYKDLLDIGKRFKTEGLDSTAMQDSIFLYVNRKVTYNNNTSVFSEKDLSQVLAGKPSDQSAINQALIMILRGAGFKANPLLISTRDWGKILTNFPSVYQFNGLIAYTHVNGKDYFMDASKPHSVPNLLPVTDINGSGFLLKADNYRWVTIDPTRSVFHMDVNLTCRLSAEGSLTGHVEASHEGYLAQQLRSKKESPVSNYDIVRSDLFGRYATPEIDSIKFRNLNDYDKPVIINADFKLKDYATSYQSGLELAPLVVGYLLKNPFGNNERSLPITLQAPEELTVHFHMKLPEGFNMKHIQNNVRMNIPGAYLSFQTHAGKKELSYDFSVGVNRKKFGTDLFPQLIDMYQKWVELSHTQIFINKL